MFLCMQQGLVVMFTTAYVYDNHTLTGYICETLESNSSFTVSESTPNNHYDIWSEKTMSVVLWLKHEPVDLQFSIAATKYKSLLTGCMMKVQHSRNANIGDEKAVVNLAI